MFWYDSSLGKTYGPVKILTAISQQSNKVQLIFYETNTQTEAGY